MAAPAGEPGPVCHKVCLEDLAAGSSGRGPTRAGRGPRAHTGHVLLECVWPGSALSANLEQRGERLGL